FIDGVDFDANDRFCLDGQRLIAVGGAYGANATEYRTEINSFSKVISYTEPGTSGIAWFRVWTRSGQILEYGFTADSRIEATNRTDGAVLIWAVSRIQDTVGNYIATSYTEKTGTGEYYPLRIDYTGNQNAGLLPNASVIFEYTGKLKTKAWLAGSSIESNVVISRITTQVGTAVVRNYNLSYKTGQATSRKQLVSVQECSPSACLPTMEFSWQDSAGADFDAITVSSHGKIYLHTYASWADVNGDGMADWVRTASAQTQVRLSNGDGTFGALIESAHGAGLLHSYASWADINGDGMADWVRTASAKTQIRLSNGDGTFGALIESAHGAGLLHTYASWADINGDGMADWVRTASVKTQVRLSNGDGTFGALIESAHGTYYLHTYASWEDVNGDGMADWVRTASAHTQVRLSNGDGTFGALIESAHGTFYLHTYASWADINGDGLADWVRTASAKTQVRLSNGDGTFGALIESAHGKSYLHTYASWVDINSDGLADWVRTASAKMQARLSNGDGTFGVLIESAHGASLLHEYSSWADVNGDGLADWVRTASAKTQVRLHAGKRPDLISTISDGVGIEINLVHTPLTDNSVYTKYTGSIYPVLDIQAPMYAVSSSSSSDGLGGLSTVTYLYEGMKVNLSGRGMLGFSKTVVTDEQTGIVTETDYSQEFPHIGMVLRTTTRLNNRLLSELSNVLDSFTTASASVYFPHVTSSTERTYDLSVGSGSLVTTSTALSIYEPGGEGIWGSVSRVTVITSAAGESHKKDTINQ
ncbi:MAG: VCBS repeat-containing protein, partial [Deltaproteobacteria bacterium]|nr:VCBS repeat-containing protein [Deltaproteobacteria bacterium]